MFGCQVFGGGSIMISIAMSTGCTITYPFIVVYLMQSSLLPPFFCLEPIVDQLGDGVVALSCA